MAHKYRRRRGIVRVHWSRPASATAQLNRLTCILPGPRLRQKTSRAPLLFTIVRSLHADSLDSLALSSRRCRKSIKPHTTIDPAAHCQLLMPLPMMMLFSHTRESLREMRRDCRRRRRIQGRAQCAPSQCVTTMGRSQRCRD